MKKYIVSPNLTVKEVIKYMDDNSLKAVVIAEEDMLIKGLFTLGDMRKYFIHGGELDVPITEAMNNNPITFNSIHEVNHYDDKLIIYPIVDSDNRIVNIIGSDSEQENSGVLSNTSLVIMAGGKGTRLYPYTKVLPKALMPIGELTISERIIGMFRKYGCKNYYMILNHKAEMIKSYFSQLKKDYSVSFEKEEAFLGTGGGLIYLKDKINNTFFLSNCDILVDADLECIYKTHKEKGNVITIVCAMKDVEIPYGIVETNDDADLINIKEKPEYSFLTNTGLYVIEPEVIQDLKDKEFIHMTDIAMKYVRKGEKVGVFPISETSWMDMGQLDEMEKMQERLGV